jgi:hypothetical protein
MDDTEKIVLYFYLHRFECARVRDIQKWTRFSDSRMNTAIRRCENTVFHWQEGTDNGLVISLIQGPVTDRILKKYGDIVGITTGRKKEEGSNGSR